MRVGLANMGIGILIAAIGALVTGLTYSMAHGSGGGTYVVAYGAFVVGAWRFLLGLFQLLRSPFGEPDVERTAPPPASTPARAEASARAAPEADGGTPSASNGLPIAGGLLIADAVLRSVSLAFLLWRIPFAAIVDNESFLLIGIVVPAILAIGAFGAGVLCLQQRWQAIPFGIGLCAVGLLYHAYMIARLLAAPFFHALSMTGIFITVHLAIYVAAVVMLARASGKRRLAQGAPG